MSEEEIEDETIEEIVEEDVQETKEEPAEKPTETRDILEEAVNKLEKEDEKENIKEEAEESEKEDKPEAGPENEQVEEEVNGEVEEEEPKPKRNRWSAWKKDAQPLLNKADPVLQDYISAREEQFHSGLNKYKDDANYAKTIKRSLAPHKEYLQSINVSEEVAIPTLIAAEKSLRMGSPEQKVQSFLKLAHDYGVDVEGLSQATFNPQLHEMEKELNATKQQVFNHEYSQQEQVEEQAALSIDEFAQSHEHFESVRQSMGDLMNLAAQKDEELTLEQAYEKAIRLDDSIFEKVNAQQQEQSRKKNLLKSTQAARVAKGAAVQVKGSPTTGKSTSTPPKTTEEAVRRAMSDMGM